MLMTKFLSATEYAKLYIFVTMIEIEFLLFRCLEAKINAVSVVIYAVFVPDFSITFVSVEFMRGNEIVDIYFYERTSSFLYSTTKEVENIAGINAEVPSFESQFLHLFVTALILVWFYQFFSR